MATANPFSLPSVGADNPLAPEYLALERQKKIADLLMQKGQEIPQGQMVSGHYVAPSWTQQLGTLANAYMGGNMAEQNEAKGAKLADLLRGQNVSEAQDILNTVKTNPQEALIKSIGARGQFGQALAPQLVSNMFKEETPLVLPEGATAVNRKGEVIASGTPKFHAPLQIDAGTHIELRDPVTNKLIEKIPKIHVYAPHATQIVDTPEGMMEYNPNNRSMTPMLVNGKPVMGTKGNLPEGATNQITGVQNVKSALGDLKSRLDTLKPQDMVNPNKRALMSTDYQNVVLQLKEAMKLGVLNGNDYQILTSMITNPNDPKALLVNKNTQLEQINNLSKKLNDMTKNVYKTHQRNVPSNLESPTISNDLVEKAIAELQKRQSGK
jgi:hypothetical protein